MKLEELARQSSDAARLSVVHLDPPAIGETRPRATWHRPVLAALAVAVLVAGVASVFLLTGDDGDGGESVVAGPLDIPRLGLPSLSAYSIVGAFELSELAGDLVGSVPRSIYYGSGVTDDPYADGDLLVLTIVGASEDDFAVSDGQGVAVRGTTATFVAAGENGLPAGLTLLQWIEPAASADGAPVGIALASRSTTEAELIDIAGRLVVDIAGAEAVVSLPGDLDFERVGDGFGTPFQNGTFAPPGSDGYLVAYEQQVADNFSSIVLSTRAGQLSEEAAALRFWSTDARSVSVGGRPGVVGSFSAGSADLQLVAHSVVWEPSDGVVATVTFTGPAEDIDVLALAESAAQLDDEAWASYRELAATPDIDFSSFDEVYGQGDGLVNDAGYAWVLGTRDGDLCIEVSAESSGMSTCQPSAQVEVPLGSARTIDNSFGEDVAYVLIAADTAVDAVQEGTAFGVIQRVEGGGTSWFLWIGSPDSSPRFQVVVDGVVVETLEAGVEGVAAAQPAIDLAANSAAQTMGIVDDFELLGNGASATVEWALGTVGGDLCLVTGGEAESAGCFPADDLTVFRALQLGDGSPLTHLVMRDLPDCVEPTGVSGLDTVSVTSLGTDDGHTYTVWALDGETSDRRLLLNDPTGNEVGVELPAVDGTTSWPAGLCSGG